MHLSTFHDSSNDRSPHISVMNIGLILKVAGVRDIRHLHGLLEVCVICAHLQPQFCVIRQIYVIEE